MQNNELISKQSLRFQEPVSVLTTPKIFEMFLILQRIDGRKYILFKLEYHLHAFTFITTFVHNYGVIRLCWGAIAERFSASKLCSDCRVVRMWVRPCVAVTMVRVSLSNIFNCTLPRSIYGYMWRVEVDIVFDKSLWRTTVAQCCMLPRKLWYWLRGNNVKRIGTLSRGVMHFLN